MAKNRLTSLIIILFIIFTSCTVNTDHCINDPSTDSDSNTVPSHDSPESQSKTDMESDSESLSHIENESFSQIPITPQETLPPEPLVVAPTVGTPGVFFAESFDDLASITEQTEFLEYSARPTICITKAFLFEYQITIMRDTDIIYLPSYCVGGQMLTVRCDKAVDPIMVSTATEALIDGGLLSIDAPYASLEVICKNPPSRSAIELYSNVTSYNGNRINSNYGGYGTDRLSDIRIINSVTGKSYDGVSFSVFGNMAVISLPLIVSEADTRSASIDLISSSGEKISIQEMDLTSQNKITITDSDEKTRSYLIISERLTYELPIMEIHTDDEKPIVDKNTYVHGSLTIDGISYGMNIRGRGNASWNHFPKKSYRIKLDDGESLFGLPQNRDWVLTSNYADKTMIRNCVAHTMAASLDGLDFTPTHIPVNLYLNGSYIGVYTFADKIEEGNGRLDLQGNETEKTDELDVGFLLEIGWDFDAENIYNRDYFDTNAVIRIYVKEPKIKEPNSREFLYVKNYILRMEEAVINNNGWENYIDVDSWIDWFIINEMTFNTESSFYRSCYLWRESGGKLMLGPVWDFDMAFGNHQGDIPGYNGWCTTESNYLPISQNWMYYLMQYDTFTDRVVKRWNEIKNDLLSNTLNAIDHYSGLLDGSQQQNFLIWDIMNVGVGVGSVSPYIYNTYDKQVQYLRDFVNTRWKYIDTRLNSSEYIHE